MFHVLQQNWKNNSKSGNPMFMDPSNPTWGWSWLERWMAGPGRPLEEPNNNLTQPNTPSSARGGTTPRNKNKNSFFSPPTPSRLNQSSRKSKDEDDAKSTISVLSERNRRHSIGGSSVKDDESMAGSQALPSYMVPTKSARARLKPQSPLSGGTITQENDGVADKASAKKRLSYTNSPALPKPRRFSAPPKVEIGDVAVTNGGGS